MRPTVAILDYGMCNLDSVARAIEYCGGNPVVTDQPSVTGSASHIILPGVGAFPDAMKNVKARGIDTLLREEAQRKRKPILGICLGMQLLASCGWEVEYTDGLELIGGEVKRLVPSNGDWRIPHIGWSAVNFAERSPLFAGLQETADFYFVHSYHFVPSSMSSIIGTTSYAGTFVSAVQQDNVFGVQFHPEKSQKTGFRILANFLAL